MSDINNNENARTPDDVLNDAGRRMSMSIEFLKRELQSVRTGRATPSIVENITADYYGIATPLGQMATISAPDAQLIMIQPWDRQSLQEIEKAIQKSSTGLNPSNDGLVVRIPIPPLSQERRKELVKSLGSIVEDSKIAVRNVRRDCQDKLRTLEKAKNISQDENQQSQTMLQKATDTHINEIDSLWKAKVEDMMKV